jgi:predicted RNA-binding protein YlqC (UPF0109 family)
VATNGRRLTTRRAAAGQEAAVQEAAVQELVEYIARALVDHPEQVRVTQVTGQESVVIELRVAPDDMGRVIGKEGRIANALRVLVRVVGAREGTRVTLEIV